MWTLAQRLLAGIGEALMRAAGKAAEEQIEARPRRIRLELTSGRLLIEGIVKVEIENENAP